MNLLASLPTAIGTAAIAPALLILWLVIAAGERPRTAKFWRATNELPFLAAIVMVLAVTLEFGHW